MSLKSLAVLFCTLSTSSAMAETIYLPQGGNNTGNQEFTQSNARQPEDILCDLSEVLVNPRLNKIDGDYYIMTDIGPLRDGETRLSDLPNISERFIERQIQRQAEGHSVLSALGEDMIVTEQRILDLTRELINAIDGMNITPDYIGPYCGQVLMSSNGLPLGFIPKT